MLGLDVGEARIGLASGRLGSPLSFGRGAIKREGTRRDVATVAALARSEGAAAVVVGLPLRLDGGDSEQTVRVRAFAAALQAELAPGVAVVLEDERLTTRAAKRQIGGGELPRGRRQEKGRLDEAAAVMILEAYLSRQMREPGP